MLKNLWCGKTSLRGYVAVAAVSSLLLLAACGGDSGTNAPSDDGISDSEKIQSSSSGQKLSSSSQKTVSSSSSEKAKSSSSVILSGDSHEESSSSSSSSLKSVSSSSKQLSSSSSEENDDGWSWDVPKEARLNPEIDYGSMTDSRDGQIYKTVKIGNQVWMAENCAVTGHFYTWAAAIDLVKLAIDVENPQDCGSGKECTLPDTVQGICPDGWHLPTQAE